MINYLKCLDLASFHAYTAHDGQEVSKLTPRENTENILQAVLAELESK